MPEALTIAQACELARRHAASIMVRRLAQVQAEADRQRDLEGSDDAP